MGRGGGGRGRTGGGPGCLPGSHMRKLVADRCAEPTGDSGQRRKRWQSSLFLTSSQFFMQLGFDFYAHTKNNHTTWIQSRRKQGVWPVWHVVTVPKMWNETYSHPVAGVIGPKVTPNDSCLLYYSPWGLLIVKTGLCCDLSKVPQCFHPMTVGIISSRPSPQTLGAGKSWSWK